MLGIDTYTQPLEPEVIEPEVIEPEVIEPVRGVQTGCYLTVKRGAFCRLLPAPL